MHTALVVILVALVSSLALALIAYLLRPAPQDDVMQQVVGDAPAPAGLARLAPAQKNLPRGGYAALSTRDVINAKRRLDRHAV